MSCRQHHRHSIFCILPPHILREIAKRGSQRQRDRALTTLSLDTTSRLRRAETAGLLGPHFASSPTKHRSVYDAGHAEQSTGKLVRDEDKPPCRTSPSTRPTTGWAPPATSTPRSSTATRSTARALPLDATVHYGQDYDNAFWDGQQMVFGDGDGELFNRFTITRRRHRPRADARRHRSTRPASPTRPVRAR